MLYSMREFRYDGTIEKGHERAKTLEEKSKME